MNNSPDRVYLIDTSGSMIRFDEEIQRRIRVATEDDMIVGTGFPYKTDSAIEILSDVGEGIPDEIDYFGPTPLTDALQTVAEMTDAPIEVISDGVPNHEDRFREKKAEISNQVIEIVLVDVRQSK